MTHLANPTAMDEHGYRLLVENSLGLMCVHDRDGVLAYVSPPAARARTEPGLVWSAQAVADPAAPAGDLRLPHRQVDPGQCPQRHR